MIEHLGQSNKPEPTSGVPQDTHVLRVDDHSQKPSQLSFMSFNYGYNIT